MQRKRLLLVNPSSPRAGFSINASSLFPPLGLGILAGLTPADWQVELIDENWAPCDFRPADLVAITAFTSRISRAYEVSNRYREQNIPVVIGGAHASAAPEEALTNCDAVVAGEAEPNWAHVLADFEAHRLHGIYRRPPGPIGMPQRAIFDARYPRDTIQTSRGCPADCDFCSVALVNGNRYRSRTLRESQLDLDSLRRQFFIVDDNFVGVGRVRNNYVRELLGHMLAGPNDRRWLCQTSIEVAEDEDLLRRMFQAGCRLLFIGIEAEDGNELLVANHKRKIECKEALRRIHQAGMAVLGSFIIGTEHDDAESMQERVNFIHTCGVDAYQVSLMTPLPGTRVFQRARTAGRLLYDDFPQDWRHFDFTDLVYLPPGFADVGAYERCVARCLNDLYSDAAIKQHARATADNGCSRESLWFAYRSNLNYQLIALHRVRAYQRATGHLAHGAD